MKKFNEFVNEGIRDLMKPKSEDDIKKSLDKLSPYIALATARKYKMNKNIIDKYLQKIKPIEDKFKEDVKKFNKSNIDKFLPFITKWMVKNGFEYYNVINTFRTVSSEIGNDYFSDETVKSYVTLLVNYLTDELKNTIFEDDNDDEGDDWLDEIDYEIEEEGEEDYEIEEEL